MKIYNSMSRKKEDFSPIDANEVRMYVCGPTVYDRIHLGNAWPVVIFDVLFRLLKSKYNVTYVRNITDVDDKINTRAFELGVPISEITAKTTQYFHEDIAALNALSPTVEPKATEHIDQMIEMIQTLISKGFAYEAEGHVLFEVNKLPSYGCLSGRALEDMIAGARVEVAPYKRNPEDFVLWKPSDEKTPGWESPWGYGRPGWHIECSAMSSQYLGKSFDIHGGGRDLIFPHHENEIAQSVGVNGEGTFAKYWMHNGMLTVNGEKMSKSLGNFVTLNEALSKHHGETIRYLLMSSHYRKSLDWTEDALSQSKAALDRIYNALREFGGESAPVDPKVIEALEDDLNTPLALSYLHDLASRVNSGEDCADVLLGSAKFLGLATVAPEEWFTWSPSSANSISPEEVEALLVKRVEARKARDFALADKIRNDLHAQGIELEDSADGTKWRRI